MEMPITPEYLRSLPTKELTALASRQIWLGFLREAPAKIRRFGQCWGISEEKVEEVIRHIQQLENQPPGRGNTMLKQGDKIRLYRKKTREAVGELFTIVRTESTEDGIKIWIKEPLGEGRPIDPITLIAVAGDDEYEVYSSWKLDRENWGLILRPK